VLLNRDSAPLALSVEPPLINARGQVDTVVLAANIDPTGRRVFVVDAAGREYPLSDFSKSRDQDGDGVDDDKAASSGGGTAGTLDTTGTSGTVGTVGTAGSRLTLAQTSSASPSSQTSPLQTGSPDPSSTKTLSPPVRYLVAAIPDGNVSYPLNERVRLRVYNRDNASSDAPERVYITTDCPRIGEWGTGDDCEPCPEGATCPGGNRIWPQNGYWNAGENSGFVERCHPAARCKGGEETTQCAVGHFGDYCGRCERGYFESGDYCDPCPTEQNRNALVAFAFVFWWIIILCTWFVRNRHAFSRIVFFVMTMQLVEGVARMESFNLGETYRRRSEYFLLFGGEFGVTKPGCWATPMPAFSTLYGLTMILNMSVGFLMWVVPFARSVLSRTADEKLFQRNRAVRAVVLWLALFYISFTRASLRVVSCRPLRGGIRAIADPTVVCFTERHKIAFTFACGVLLFITVGFPAWYLRKMLSTWSVHFLYADPSFAERFDLLYVSFRPKFRYCFLPDMLARVVLSAGPTVLRNDPRAQFSSTFVTFLIYLLVMGCLRPYALPHENWVMIPLCAAMLAAACLNYVGHRDQLDAEWMQDGYGDMLLYSVIVMGAIGSAALFAGAVYYFWRPAEIFDYDKINDARELRRIRTKVRRRNSDGEYETTYTSETAPTEDELELSDDGSSDEIRELLGVRGSIVGDERLGGSGLTLDAAETNAADDAVSWRAAALNRGSVHVNEIHSRRVTATLARSVAGVFGVSLSESDSEATDDERALLFPVLAPRPRKVAALSSVVIAVQDDDSSSEDDADGGRTDVASTVGGMSEG
jgi:hypothetical protein